MTNLYDKAKAALTGHRGIPLYDRLDTVQSDLQNIDDVEQLAGMPGWQKIEGVLRDRIDYYQDQQNKLSRNPQKNAGEIQDINALREAMTGLLGLLQTTLNAKPELIKREKELSELATTAELQKRQPGAVNER